jgi:hypothetical protein
MCFVEDDQPPPFRMPCDDIQGVLRFRDGDSVHQRDVDRGGPRRRRIGLGEGAWLVAYGRQGLRQGSPFGALLGEEWKIEAVSSKSHDTLLRDLREDGR